MNVWGLTGGIASGKSTVARLCARLGLPVVDADALYHELVAPVPQAGPEGRLVASPLAQAIGDAFAGVLEPNGLLNRRKLGGVVFADTGARETLESITHPAVARQAEEQFQRLAAMGHAHALYDVPLLYERALSAKFAGVVVVWVPRDTQLARLKQRDQLTDEAAVARLAAQLPLDDKKAQATFVIDNSGTAEQTEQQVRALCAHILR